MQALDVSDVHTAFERLLHAVGVEPPGTSPGSHSLGVFRSLVAALPRLPQRLAQLVSSLEKRLSHAQYGQGHAAEGLRATILGAGPVGLRCAVELALLGCSVTVIEGRASWTRLNVLHLWQWVEADLTELGVKLLDPSVFSAAEFTHCATRQLQVLLLKVGLLLGIFVRVGCQIAHLDERFKTTLQRLARDGREADVAEDGMPVDLLVDATGARCPLFNDLGFEQTTMLRGARALGITLHLKHTGESWESRLQEGNWAHQFHQERFSRLASTTGVALQNIVYYNQPNSSHYFVMTAEAEGLLKAGALISKDDPELVGPHNVSMAKLEAFSRAAIAEFAPRLKEQPMLPRQLQIFDFSERRQSNVASLVLPAERFGGSYGRRMIVTRVGDALQEPFWPEGLGINRGFLHCLDCADLALGQAELERQRNPPSPPPPPTPGPPSPAFDLADASGGRAGGGVNGTEGTDGAPEPVVDYEGELARLVQRREDLYTCTKRVSGTTIKSELKPTTDAKRELRYRIDPKTRYTHLPPGTDWEPEVTRQLEAKRRNKERAEAAQYEAAFASWSAELAAAQRELDGADEGLAKLNEQEGRLVEAAEAATAAADECRRTRAERREELESALERSKSVVGRQSFALRDLEVSRLSSATGSPVGGGGGAGAGAGAGESGGASAAELEERRQARQAQVQAKLQAATEEAERHQAELDLLVNAESEGDAAAEAARAAVDETRRLLEAATQGRERHVAALHELRAREPERPAHMQGFDSWSA